jgi:isoleucyl-tRNA synthetase
VPRAFAEHWIGVQREEFKRLGVDRRLEEPLHDHGLPGEAQIVREIMKFADERRRSIAAPSR